MNVTVHIHASLKEIAGAGSLELSVDEDSIPERAVQVRHVRKALEDAHPKIRGRLAQARIAVDMEIVGEEHPVRERQRVDVLPPFSGG